MDETDSEVKIEKPSPEEWYDDRTTTRKVSQEAKERWANIMKQVGILPKYREAKLKGNCQVYAAHEGKSRALDVLTRFSDRPEDNTERWGVRKNGILYHSVVLVGDFGTGKTWLGTAAFKRILYQLQHQEGRSASGMWRRFHTFVGEVQSTYSTAAEETSQQVISRFQNTDLLMLDEVGDLKKMDESQDRREMFYRVIDVRNASYLPTIITTNLSPDELMKQFGERTFERIKEMSVFVQMQGRNFRDDPLNEEERYYE